MAKPKKSKRSYGDDDRAACLAALAANGGNLAKTARQCGVPRKTLAGWAKEQAEAPADAPGSPPKKGLAAQVAKAKEALSDRFERLAESLLIQAEGGTADLGPKEAIIAAAVCVDKMLLLRGEPTSISEQHTDERLAIFRQRYAGNAASPARADAG